MGDGQGGFFQRVYDVVARIPKGKVMTYGQIAKGLGGFYSGRTVGFAMRAAPGERGLPCHRVINQKGEMAPGFCFGGAENQRRLLRKEGVKFHRDGRVDFDKSLFRPADAPLPASLRKAVSPCTRRSTRRPSTTPSRGGTA